MGMNVHDLRPGDDVYQTSPEQRDAVRRLIEQILGGDPFKQDVVAMILGDN